MATLTETEVEQASQSDALLPKLVSGEVGVNNSLVVVKELV